MGVTDLNQARNQLTMPSCANNHVSQVLKVDVGCRQRDARPLSICPRATLGCFALVPSADLCPVEADGYAL